MVEPNLTRVSDIYNKYKGRVTGSACLHKCYGTGIQVSRKLICS